MLRPRTKPSNLISGINVAAFAGVMFVLLFFMIFARPFATYGGSTDLPRVSRPMPMRGANREDAMTLTIMRDGKVFFRSDQVYGDASVAKLTAKIREAVKDGSERKIYIRADARAKYGTVKEALDAIRDAGIEKVAFLTDQRRQSAP